MSQQPRWHHSNRYSADSACVYCGGVIRHEAWCATRNGAVAYAFNAATGRGGLTMQDRLILHSLGVEWAAAACGGKCRELQEDSESAGDSAAPR